MVKNNVNLQNVFDELKPVYKRFEARAFLRQDEPGKYYLGSHEVRVKDGYRTDFGGVEIKKNYVSAHLMPVYVHPDLLEKISPVLKKRMQGKSCFNFRSVDRELLKEFSDLAQCCFDRFQEDGRFSAGP